MHTLQLSLNTTSYDKQQIERRFHAVSHIHNVTVKHAIKLINQLKHDKAYRSHLSEYVSIKKKEKLSSRDKKRLKPETIHIVCSHSQYNGFEEKIRSNKRSEHSAML